MLRRMNSFLRELWLSRTNSESSRNWWKPRIICSIILISLVQGPSRLIGRVPKLQEAQIRVTSIIRIGAVHLLHRFLRGRFMISLIIRRKWRKGQELLPKEDMATNKAALLAIEVEEMPLITITNPYRSYLLVLMTISMIFHIID